MMAKQATMGMRAQRLNVKKKSQLVIIIVIIQLVILQIITNEYD